MQNLTWVLLTYLLSHTAHAKLSSCEFDNEFIEKYVEARINYAKVLKDKKARDDGKGLHTGKMRLHNFGSNWPDISLTKKMNQLFGDQEVIISVKENGKMIIYPKAMKEPGPIILFDPSGDYFRIVKSRVHPDGKVSDSHTYYDINGNKVEKPHQMSKEEGEAFVQSKTHFKASP